MDAIFDPQKADTLITGEFFCNCALASQWRSLRPHSEPRPRPLASREGEYSPNCPGDMGWELVLVNVP